jgi:hypothetical protein
VRVDGLDTLRRLPETKLEVTPAMLQACRDYFLQRDLQRVKAEGRDTLPVAPRKEPPTVDGKLDDWVQAAWVTVGHIVTGGNQPGDRFTEASTSSEYLQERGVPASAILFEDTGRSSWESLQNVADVADRHGIGSVILVSDPFHSLRIRLMAEELGLRAHTSSTRTSPVGGLTAFKKHVEEAGGVALGRVLGFERTESLLG